MLIACCFTLVEYFEQAHQFAETIARMVEECEVSGTDVEDQYSEGFRDIFSSKVISWSRIALVSVGHHIMLRGCLSHPLEMNMAPRLWYGLSN